MLPIDSPRRPRAGRAVAVSLSGALLCAAGGVLVATPAAAVQTVVTAEFPYTGGPQAWTVPAGVVSASFVLQGASGGQGGGAGAAAVGGRGGELRATLVVVPGSIYTVMVGGAGAGAEAGGAGGFNGGGSGGAANGTSIGGGGGGATDLRSGADRLLVAGGGGGSSSSSSPPPDEGFLPSPAAAGGDGGGADGTVGGGDPSGGGGGGGATTTAPGAPGPVSPTSPGYYGGAAGAEGTGGVGGGGFPGGAGGGGGGGWYGGGGGAGANVIDASGGGGGGGSGHADPTATDVVALAGVGGGDGHVTISYLEPIPASIAGTPPAGVLGQPYSFAFSLNAAAGVNCWVSLGTLPPGLDLDAASCTLAGTPRVGGDYPLVIGAGNGVGDPAYVTVTMTVTVPAPPELPSLPSGIELTGTVGEPFSFLLPVVGSPTVTLEDPDGLPAGLTLDPDGLIHGTPTQVDARFGVDVRLVNDAGTNFGSFRFFVDGIPAAFTSGAPTDVTYGRPYSFAFTGTGVPAPRFRLAGGQLPSGLSLDHETGVLSGTTHELGSFPVVIGAQGWGAEVQQAYTLRVLGAAPRINDAPPPATVDTSYWFAFDTTGSNPSPTFTLASGTLPAGLSLYGNGVITGFPTAVTAGSAVTVRATNGTDPAAEQTFTLPVDGRPQGIAGTPPTGVAVGADYTFGYTLTGTPAPTAAVTSGTLPPGLALSAEGYLSGAPTTPGSWTFTVAARGGTGPEASVTSTIEVLAPALTVTGTPPAGGIGEPYAFAFSANGPATFRVSAGALPRGLALYPSGRLSGTPTRAGTFAFTVRAEDGARAEDLAVSMTIRSLPTISICDAAIAEGNTGTRSLTLHLTLSRASTVPVTVRWSTANGTASAASDYVAASGTVTFAAGQTVRTVTVSVKGDRTRERHEAFAVRLASPASAMLGKATGVAGIVNDD